MRETSAGLAFGSLFGYQDWPVQAEATADIAYASYEIALVLDTTGSMKGGKLSSMKDAVLGLIGTMSVQVDDEDKLKFAVVPFAAFVNVGTEIWPSVRQEGQAGRRHRRRLAGPSGRFDGAAVGARRRRQPVPALQPISGRAGRAASRRATRPTRNYDVDDTPADPAKAETLFMPAFAIDEPDTPQFSNSYINSDAKPKDKSVAEKKKRWAKYGVATDAAGNPLHGGLLDRAVGRAHRRCSVHTTARRRSRSTPARPRATASQRGRAMAATSSRSRR